MTSDREKLIELLCADPCTAMSTDDCDTCELRYISNCYSICMADILLANGVTFAKDTDVPSKWISVDERLPNELPKDGSAWSERVRPSVDVLVKMKGLKELYTAWYSYSRKEWIDVSETHNLGDSVTHWMPLPQPPREE